MTRFLKYISLIFITSLFAGSCSPTTRTVIPSPHVDPVYETSTPPMVVTEAPVVDEADLLDAAINPLTGLPVEDPELLNLPAALVSIAHFPVTARPQAGLSYAPYVFEVYITEGATRFLSAFYGQLPRPEPFISGNCDVRNTPFTQTESVLGNRVWLDSNRNNIEDAWEPGVGGVCVDLYDANTNLLLQKTTTDSNGFYGFNVADGKYFVEVQKPKGMELDQKDAGDDSQNSDVNPDTGRSDAVNVKSTRLNLDAGLTLLHATESAADLPIPYVGPVRSGRLVYADIANFFPGSCLIFAYASAEVLVELPTCAFVDHILQGGGYMLEIEKMKQLVEERKNVQTRKYYTSNNFSSDPPEGGKPADRLDVYFAWLNQSAWVYDAASQSWWRYVDNADEQSAGVLHPEVDRLNNRQLQFENVIVLFAYHDVISPTNLNIHLEQDWVGNALLFRDGKMYKIRWSTVSTAEQVLNGTRKPIRFYYPDDKTLFPLKPGNTWVTVVTPLTPVTETSAGDWLLQFSQPEGAK